MMKMEVVEEKVSILKENFVACAQLFGPFYSFSLTRLVTLRLVNKSAPWPNFNLLWITP